MNLFTTHPLELNDTFRQPLQPEHQLELQPQSLLPQHDLSDPSLLLFGPDEYELVPYLQLQDQPDTPNPAAMAKSVEIDENHPFDETMTSRSGQRPRFPTLTSSCYPSSVSPWSSPNPNQELSQRQKGENEYDLQTPHLTTPFFPHSSGPLIPPPLNLQESDPADVRLQAVHTRVDRAHWQRHHAEVGDYHSQFEPQSNNPVIDIYRPRSHPHSFDCPTTTLAGSHLGETSDSSSKIASHAPTTNDRYEPESHAYLAQGGVMPLPPTGCDIYYYSYPQPYPYHYSESPHLHARTSEPYWEYYHSTNVPVQNTSQQAHPCGQAVHEGDPCAPHPNDSDRDHLTPYPADQQAASLPSFSAVIDNLDLDLSLPSASWFTSRFAVDACSADTGDFPTDIVSHLNTNFAPSRQSRSLGKSNSKRKPRAAPVLPISAIVPSQTSPPRALSPVSQSVSKRARPGTARSDTRNLRLAKAKRDPSLTITLPPPLAQAPNPAVIATDPAAAYSVSMPTNLPLMSPGRSRRSRKVGVLSGRGQTRPSSSDGGGGVHSTSGTDSWDVGLGQEVACWNVAPQIPTWVPPAERPLPPAAIRASQGSGHHQLNDRVCQTSMGIEQGTKDTYDYGQSLTNDSASLCDMSAHAVTTNSHPLQAWFWLNDGLLISLANDSGGTGVPAFVEEIPPSDGLRIRDPTGVDEVELDLPLNYQSIPHEVNLPPEDDNAGALELYIPPERRGESIPYGQESRLHDVLEIGAQLSLVPPMTQPQEDESDSGPYNFAPPFPGAGGELKGRIAMPTSNPLASHLQTANDPTDVLSESYYPLVAVDRANNAPKPFTFRSISDQPFRNPYWERTPLEEPSTKDPAGSLLFPATYTDGYPFQRYSGYDFVQEEHPTTGTTDFPDYGTRPFLPPTPPPSATRAKPDPPSEGQMRLPSPINLPRLFLHQGGPVASKIPNSYPHSQSYYPPYTTKPLAPPARNFRLAAQAVAINEEEPPFDEGQAYENAQGSCDELIDIAEGASSSTHVLGVHPGGSAFEGHNHYGAAVPPCGDEGLIVNDLLAQPQPRVPQLADPCCQVGSSVQQPAIIIPAIGCGVADPGAVSPNYGVDCQTNAIPPLATAFRGLDNLSPAHNVAGSQLEDADSNSEEHGPSHAGAVVPQEESKKKKRQTSTKKREPEGDPAETAAPKVKRLKVPILKKHQCPKCPAEFTRPSDLERHGRTRHSDERPFICPYCKGAFARGDKLYTHIQNLHERRSKSTCRGSTSSLFTRKTAF